MVTTVLRHHLNAQSDFRVRRRCVGLLLAVIAPALYPSCMMRLFLLAVLLFLAAFAAFMFLTVQPAVMPVRSVPAEVDPGRLETHVKRLSTDFFPRSHDHVENLDLASRYILNGFKAAGAEVALQEVLVRGQKYKNVIARFGPQSGPLLVIGAHYDSNAYTAHDAGDPRGYTVDTHTPGADDNASGVAGLLELARLLGKREQSQAVELVAYTLEEAPHFRSVHMGSVWHARALKAAGRGVRLMLSLEMIGYFRDEPGSQSYPFPGMSYLYSDRGDFIALVGRFQTFAPMRRAKSLMSGATDLPIHSINAPPFVPGIDLSDHRSYWNEGFPALMVTDTAFYRNPHYHRAGDTYDTLDYPRMAEVVKGVYALTQDF